MYTDLHIRPHIRPTDIYISVLQIYTSVLRYTHIYTSVLRYLHIYARPGSVRRTAPRTSRSRAATGKSRGTPASEVDISVRRYTHPYTYPSSDINILPQIYISVLRYIRPSSVIHIYTSVLIYTHIYIRPSSDMYIYTRVLAWSGGLLRVLLLLLYYFQA